MDKASTLLKQAKSKLLLNYPFFGSLATTLKFDQNDNIQAFLSDGDVLEYNDEYIEDLDSDELEFVLSNAAMHQVLKHQKRANGRYKWLWQLSLDYSINSMLVQNGLDAPLGVSYDERFDNLYAEEIYEILKDEIKNEDYDDDESNEDGYNEENKSTKKQQESPKSSKTNEKIEADFVEQLLNDAIEKSKENLPDGIDRFIDQKYLGKVDWRALLRDYINTFYKDDYTMMPPSKKLLYAGIYLPSSTSSKLKIAIAVDSSGSIETELLEIFLSEVELILESFDNFEIEFIVCDYKIRSHKTYYKGDALDYELQGGAGTSFKPIFEYLEDKNEDYDLLLYFTDLEGEFPLDEANFDTIWVTKSELQPPFGEVINIL